MPELSPRELELQKKKLAMRLPPALGDGPDPLCGYAELHCLSNFSFLRGASHPEELIERAYALGYQALALTDECSVAGVVRAHMGLKDFEQMLDEAEADEPGVRYRRRHPAFRFLPGSEFALDDCRLVVLPHNLEGWGHLCEFITAARGRAAKGAYQVDWSSGWQRLTHCEVLYVPRRADSGLAQDGESAALRASLAQAKRWFGSSLWLAVELLGAADDALWLQTLQRLGLVADVPLVAAGDVHMHVRSRKPLHDVLTAIRLGKTVADCGFALLANAERRLRHRMQLAGIYPADLLANTLVVMERCQFSLEQIRYYYPQETVPKGLTPSQALRRMTIEGARQRYPSGIPVRVQRFLVKELKLITACAYEMYFLTVHDIVRFARSQKILCQGRGSAANSVVCFCLGVTAMDPMHSHPLLERFISLDRRNEPPDIDVDFEHERREEVIQYIYKKYGRERAAIAAVVICYRTRSAIRDVGTALGIPAALVDAFAKEHHWFDDQLITDRMEALAQQTGERIGERQVLLWLELVVVIKGFPRHLSQHVGGFVLTQTQLTRLVPIENAAMKERSVIQWEKDDLERMGLMKVDVLALGMLTALRRCLDFRNRVYGADWELADVPREDPETYDMICKADTVGVFQIESRAQMSMLPRLKPQELYDLVVEVAIVRPGPIQGGMVHPYLKARERVLKDLPIAYEKPELKKALERTLGVPIFQEQVMQLSMDAAGFTAGEADALRRAMAAWKKKGGVEKFEKKLIQGMLANGYNEEFARRIYKQICGFGEYGFPESHAYSFALLAYASSYLKCHEPACFLAAMLNSQPMGFYPPSQLIQDAQRHGVEVRPADVVHSDWDCTLEDVEQARRIAGRDGRIQPVVRLGLRLVGSFTKACAQRIALARSQAPFSSVEDLSLRAQIDVKDLRALASADALRTLAGHRRQQVWEAASRHRAPELLREAPVNEEALELPPAPEGEDILFDYASMGLTLRRHPVAVIRPRLARMKLLSAADLRDLPSGRKVRACGIVTVRQQPQTANGTIFVTLEDETGPVNVIVWKHVREQQRAALLHSRLLAVQGIWQRDVDSGGEVRHLIAQQLRDLTPLLGRLGQLGNKSRDFH